MFGQMIAAHKALVANGTSESLLASVRAQMALQFIRPGEPFATKQPVANERSFASVPAKMRLQMARLPVHFAASGNMTTMYILLAQMDTGRP